MFNVRVTALAKPLKTRQTGPVRVAIDALGKTGDKTRTHYCCYATAAAITLVTIGVQVTADWGR